MSFVFSAPFALIAAPLILAAGAWLWLLASAKRRPWDAEALRARRRRPESVMLACVATIALLGGLAELKNDSDPPWVVVGLGANRETRNGTGYEIVPPFRVGPFKSGSDCQLEDGAGSLESQIHNGAKISDQPVEPNQIAWAVVIGGHDRVPYAGKQHDSNMDLAFSRAECVATKLRAQFDVEDRELHILTAPGGSRSEPETRQATTRDDPDHRAVEVFVYLKNEKEG